MRLMTAFLLVVLIVSMVTFAGAMALVVSTVPAKILVGGILALVTAATASFSLAYL